MSLLNAKKIAPWAIAGIVVVGLIWLFTHWPVTGSVDVRWPTKSATHTLLLRPADSKESTRLIDYAADQTTITGMRIEFRDGTTALISYQNGKPTVIRQYYPDPAAKDADTTKLVSTLKTLADGLNARALKTNVELKDDGVTIKTLTTYDTAGHYASVAVRDANNDFAVTEYGANGGNGIASVALYDGTTGMLKSRQDFNADGSLASTYAQTNSWGNAKQTFFDKSGNKTRDLTFNGRWDVVMNEYTVDGKLTKTTDFGYSGVTITEFDATGTKKLIERAYNGDASSVTVRYFDDKGTATMKQNWEKLDSAKMPADRVQIVNDGYVLHEVYELHTDGYSAKTDITFYPGGKVVKEVETRPTTDYRPMKDQFFREDGSLDYTNDCPASSVSWNCQTTKMPAGPNSVRVKVPSSFYRVTPLLPLPSMDKPEIPTFPVKINLH